MYLIAAQESPFELLQYELQYLIEDAWLIPFGDLFSNEAEIASEELCDRRGFVVLSKLVCGFGKCGKEGILELRRIEVQCGGN